MNSQLIGWVALCLIPRIGGKTLSGLLDAFGSPRAVFDASPEALLDVPLIGRKTIDAIREIDLAQVEQQIAAWEEDGITLLTWQDRHYPTPFLDLNDRPPLLFARGELSQKWERVIGIVGTREPDIEAVSFAENAGRELAQRGWLVVSGLARGIDAAAHRGAVKSGRTVAILGSGVSNIQPMSNRELARQLMRQGAIYAEVAPETLPGAATLMARNRLISGLAKALIVVQAGIESGSMEAARRARQQQRTVLTLDHPEYEGNQALLRMEAQPLDPNLCDWDRLADLLEKLPDPPKQLSLF